MLFEVVTWGRGEELAGNWYKAVLPIVFTLVIGSQVSISIPVGKYDSRGVLVIAALAGGGALTFAYILTKSASKNICHPSFHTTPILFLSLLAMFLISTITVYLGYLIFYVSQGASIVPSVLDLAVGFVFVALLTVFLTEIKRRVVEDDGDAVAKSEDAQLVSDAVSNIYNGSADFEDTERLISGLVSIAEMMDQEPLTKDNKHSKRIKKWCDTCSSSNTLSSRLRMIPGSSKPPTSDRTRQQESRFKQIENDLRTLGVINEERGSS